MLHHLESHLKGTKVQTKSQKSTKYLKLANLNLNKNAR